MKRSFDRSIIVERRKPNLVDDLHSEEERLSARRTGASTLTTSVRQCDAKLNSHFVRVNRSRKDGSEYAAVFLVGDRCTNSAVVSKC